MEFEHFIARRLRSSFQGESTVSARIIKIAVVAIALGMVMMLIALGTGLGLQQAIAKKTVALTGDIQIAPFDNNESLMTPLAFDLGEINKSTWMDSSKIHKVYAYAAKGVLLKFKDEFEGGIVRGVDRDFSWSSLMPYFVEGKFPVFGDQLSREIVLSSTMASKLGVEVGDRLTAFFQTEGQALPRKRYFTVAAIFETGFPDFDNTLALVDLRQVQQINRWTDQQVGGVVIHLDPHIDAGPVAEQIYQRIPSHLDVRTVDQLYASIYDWIALFDFNILIILIIMIAVGTLNMATALLILILERARMVGVLKVLGATGRQIQKIFLWNAFYILLRGLFFGNVIGLALLFVQWQWQWISLDPSTYFVTTVPVALPFFLWVGLNCLVLLVALLLLWLPSLIINKIDPATVLQIR